eukprot:TRINITY_DN209_c0_g1_i2.p1 TRINITY_DN209_c0_g1~~TRINITY_DN209_c0_g1_i2.p1  ORF type:complete len:154 (-),score=30.68 TRINITY_DN209_c0_g1_i2:82-543(-)
MDNQKKARNWYFFRQRIKKQKVVFWYQNRLVLKMISDLNYLRTQLNSATHSLSSELSQKSIVYDSLDKLKYLAHISQARMCNQQSIIQNLKRQIEILQNPNSKSISRISISKPILTNPRRKKKRRLSHFSVLFIPSPDHGGYKMDENEELDLF